MNKDDSRCVGILFPGQGSQEPYMGRDVAEHWDEAMGLWRKAEAVSGLPLREIYWESEHAGMADTGCLQPALTVVNLSLWARAKAYVRPVAAAGHSLGEYSALYAAGVLTVDDVLKAVALRGRLMAEAAGPVAGGMAAILKLSQEAVEEIVTRVLDEEEGVLGIANYNTPGQFVLSGEARLVQKAGALCAQNKGRAVPLAVSGAFHSPLMAEAAQELSRYLKQLAWSPAKLDVYLNSTAEAERDPARIRDIMCAQMTSSVFWIQLIRNQYQAGVRTFYEFGPKGVLTRMTGQILKGLATDFQAAQISDLNTVSTLKPMT